MCVGKNLLNNIKFCSNKDISPYYSNLYQCHQYNKLNCSYYDIN